MDEAPDGEHMIIRPYNGDAQDEPGASQHPTPSPHTSSSHTSIRHHNPTQQHTAHARTHTDTRTHTHSQKKRPSLLLPNTEGDVSVDEVAENVHATTPQPPGYTIRAGYPTTTTIIPQFLPTLPPSTSGSNVVQPVYMVGADGPVGTAIGPIPGPPASPARPPAPSTPFVGMAYADTDSETSPLQKHHMYFIARSVDGNHYRDEDSEREGSRSAMSAVMREDDNHRVVDNAEDPVDDLRFDHISDIH